MSLHHQSYQNLANQNAKDKLDARCLQGLTASFKDLRSQEKDP